MSGLLQELLANQALIRPDAVAIESGHETVSYGELERGANQLACLLRKLGCRHGDRIGLLMPKSVRAITSMLAVLKAGAAYIPLDAAGPAARLARILKVSDCRFVLACGPTCTLLRETLSHANLGRPPSLVWLDPDQSCDAGCNPIATIKDAADMPADSVSSGGRDSDVAHVLFTSGSTGLPKGVMVTHRSVRQFLEWAWSYFRMCDEDRLSQHAPLHFDLSTFDVYGALGIGARLCLVPPMANLLPHKLARFICEKRLTQWFSVPSALTLMATQDAIPADGFPSLRRVIWCGEVIPTPTLIRWMRRVPAARFTNLYGPTETTIASCHFTVQACPSRDRDVIPIGMPCNGEDLLILDEQLRPVPDGDTGELYIGGAGVSPGYLNDAPRTADAFVRRPGSRSRGDLIYRTGDLARRDRDGQVLYLGRVDSQIKSRGYRIELGEIESALYAIPTVRESAVVAIESEGFERWTICCAYVPARGADGVDATALRRSLAGALPSYMLPARWQALDELPMNANGKVDRPGLRRLFARASANDATRASSEVPATSGGA